MVEKIRFSSIDQGFHRSLRGLHEQLVLLVSSCLILPTTYELPSVVQSH